MRLVHLAPHRRRADGDRDNRRPTQTPAPTLYGVQEFGPAGAPSGATDVSEFGSPIVGHVRSSSGADRAAVLSFNGYRELGTLGGADEPALGAYYSIVVGQAQTASGQFHAFRADITTAGTPALVDLGTLGGSSSVAYATDHTNVVGSAQVSGNARWQAFIWTNGVMNAVPVQSQGNSSANDVVFGQVVGHACASGNSSCVAFWMKEGTVTTLPTLGGSTSANAINGWEQIAGVSTLPSGAHHAFLYENGTMADLQTLGGTNSEALDMNDAGHIVGVADTATGGQHAFVYRNGAMTDLNTLLPSGSGWVLQRANGISAGGQIVGVGTFNGQARGFLLTPPADVFVLPGGQRSQEDSNLPRGVEVGKTIRLVDTVWATPDPLAVSGVKITATLTGPAEYEAVRMFDGGFSDGSECQVAAKTITCDVPPLDTTGFGMEFWFTVRTTGPGSISHSVTATSEIPDPNPANNSLREDNRAVALANLELTPPTIAGGKASSARITLTDTLAQRRRCCQALEQPAGYRAGAGDPHRALPREQLHSRVQHHPGGGVTADAGGDRSHLWRCDADADPDRSAAGADPVVSDADNGDRRVPDVGREARAQRIGAQRRRGRDDHENQQRGGGPADGDHPGGRILADIHHHDEHRDHQREAAR